MKASRMQGFFILACSLLFSLSEATPLTISSFRFPAPPTQPASPVPAPKFREGELLVKFREGVTAEDMAKTNRVFGSNVIRRGNREIGYSLKKGA